MQDLISRINDNSAEGSVASLERLQVSGMPHETLTATSDGQCEGRIREKAYYLWLNAGCPEGDGKDFWYQAISK